MRRGVQGCRYLLMERAWWPTPGASRCLIFRTKPAPGSARTVVPVRDRRAGRIRLRRTHFVRLAGPSTTRCYEVARRLRHGRSIGKSRGAVCSKPDPCLVLDVGDEPGFGGCIAARIVLVLDGEFALELGVCAGIVGVALQVVAERDDAPPVVTVDPGQMEVVGSPTVHVFWALAEDSTGRVVGFGFRCVEIADGREALHHQVELVVGGDAGEDVDDRL